MSTEGVTNKQYVYELGDIEYENLDEQRELLRKEQKEVPEEVHDTSNDNSRIHFELSEIKDQNDKSFNKAENISLKNLTFLKALKLVHFAVISPIAVPLCLVGAGCSLLGYGVTKLQIKFERAITNIDEKLGLAPQGAYKEALTFPDAALAKREKFFKETGTTLWRMPYTIVYSCLRDTSRA